MSAVAHVFYPDVGWNATISLTSGSTASGYSLTSMQDGSMATTWKSGALSGSIVIKIDLGSLSAFGALCILGHNLYSARNAGATYTDIVIEHSTDDVSYTTVIDSTAESAMRITSDLPYIITPDVAARYIKITLTDPVGARAHAPEIAELFVAGADLSLTEPTSFRWTPFDAKMHSRSAGSDMGMGIPALPGHVTQPVTVEIGKQGIANTFFDDCVPSGSYPKVHGAPSFLHFIRTCWAMGGRFVYAPVYDNQEPAWYLMYDEDAGTFQVGEVVEGTVGGTQATVLQDVLQFGDNRILLVTDWDWTAWDPGETEITGLTSGATGEFIAFLSPVDAPELGAYFGVGAYAYGQQRHWLGATVCRAPANGKIRTPFVESWRRKFQMDMESTAEWTGR